MLYEFLVGSKEFVFVVCGKPIVHRGGKSQYDIDEEKMAAVSSKRFLRKDAVCVLACGEVAEYSFWKVTLPIFGRKAFVRRLRVYGKALQCGLNKCAYGLLNVRVFGVAVLVKRHGAEYETVGPLCTKRRHLIGMRPRLRYRFEVWARFFRQHGKYSCDLCLLYGEDVSFEYINEGTPWPAEGRPRCPKTKAVAAEGRRLPKAGGKLTS